MSLTCACEPKDRTKWRVQQRMCSGRTFTARSSVTCLGCFQAWRTDASYVARLPDFSKAELDKLLHGSVDEPKRGGAAMTDRKPVCGESTSRLFHGCGKPVWSERPNDGRCKIHHPDTIRAQREAKRPRWKLEATERDARLDRQDAERELMEYLVGTPEKPKERRDWPTAALTALDAHAATVIDARAKHRAAFKKLQEFDAQLKKKGIKP